ncbi:hypothetical protein [Williamsia herbipolensis]|uniref:hypothetical protein n=1 Tax=Williamsia herbipolensis TaxID=1603258 RepID=UPI0005F7AE86|nr:hypothetical protein [Williamsia herbipolensis]
MTNYLNDEIYERRRRRRIATLVGAGALLVVATDVTAAVQWATGARSAGGSVTTLLISVAVVVAATWQFTHPPQPTCGWHVSGIGGAYAAGAALCRDELPETTAPEDGRPSTTDEGEQR